MLRYRGPKGPTLYFMTLFYLLTTFVSFFTLNLSHSLWVFLLSLSCIPACAMLIWATSMLFVRVWPWVSQIANLTGVYVILDALLRPLVSLRPALLPQYDRIIDLLRSLGTRLYLLVALLLVWADLFTFVATSRGWLAEIAALFALVLLISALYRIFRWLSLPHHVTQHLHEVNGRDPHPLWLIVAIFDSRPLIDTFFKTSFSSIAQFPIVPTWMITAFYILLRSLGGRYYAYLSLVIFHVLDTVDFKRVFDLFPGNIDSDYIASRYNPIANQQAAHADLGDVRPYCDRADNYATASAKPTWVQIPTLATYSVHNSQTAETLVICLEYYALMRKLAPGLSSSTDPKVLAQRLLRRVASNNNINLPAEMDYDGHHYLNDDIMFSTATAASFSYFDQEKFSNGFLDNHLPLSLISTFTKEFTAAQRRLIKRKKYSLLAVLLLGIIPTALPKLTGYVYSELAPSQQAKPLPPQGEGRLVLHYDAKNHLALPQCPVSIPLFQGALNDPHPSLTHPSNFVDGFRYRVNTALPAPVPAVLAAFDNYSRTMIDEIFTPLTALPAFRDWIENANYPTSVKDKAWQSYVNSTERLRNTTFIKQETYPSFKPPRLIMNVSQGYKNIEGPIMKHIEHHIKGLPWTMKGKPVNEWASHVQNFSFANNQTCYVTDFTSFESSFTAPIKDVLENRVVSRVLQNFPQVADYLNQVQSGARVYHWRKHLGRIVNTAKRASGDMRTSVMNTISNYIVTKFVLRESGMEHADVFVEGDDGLICTSDLTRCPRADIYAQLGFSIKLEQHNISDSSFCGFRFSPRNEAMGNLGVYPKHLFRLLNTTHVRLNRAKQLGVLKAQAISYRLAFSADPLVTALSNKVLSLLKSTAVHIHDARDWWLNRTGITTVNGAVSALKRIEEENADPLRQIDLTSNLYEASTYNGIPVKDLENCLVHIGNLHCIGADVHEFLSTINMWNPNRQSVEDFNHEFRM